MLRRVLLRTLVPAAILAACLAQLALSGSRAKRIVAENLPYPTLSAATRDVDLWHPTTAAGRVYDLTFVWPADRPWSVPAGTRLEVQVVTNGRTRPLVVRNGHPNDDVSIGDVLRGKERLQVVGDRAWLDLGVFPEAGTQLEAQIYGLLPEPFGFVEPYKAEAQHFSAFRLRRPDSPLARPARSFIRYRFRVPDPVAPGETLARFFFFVSTSRVLAVTFVLALALLFAGWWWLLEGRAARAVACLVPAVTLLHACSLAPLQGADEATHVGTVEAVLFAPELFRKAEAYPESIAILYGAIGYESWVRFPDVPVTGLLPGNRAAARASISKVLAAEAAEDAGRRPDAVLIDPRIRAPLYYNAFRLAGPLLRRLTVLDRVESYVVLSALLSLALFLAGLRVLARSAPRIVTIYGVVALWPYSVGVVASCSNYSLAIGIGQLLAACLVAAILVEDPRRRLALAGAFSSVAFAGIGVWDDFVFLAVPSLATLTVLAARAAWRLPAGPRRTLATGATLAAGAAAILALAFALLTGGIRRLVSSLGARLPRELGGFEDPSLWLLFAAAAAPFVAGLILILSILRARDWTAETRARAAWIRSGLLLAFLFGMFLATRWTAVLFEKTRLDYPDEVFTHLASFWSNNFAFDQDILSWQMYWGVFGYADVSYPMAIYALARWATVGLLLALPVLSWRFTQRDAPRSAILVAASAFALSVCIVTNSLRYFAPTNPWGRFLLPALPLLAVPLLARAADPLRRVAGVVFALLVALHVWTAVALLGSRYAVGL